MAIEWVPFLAVWAAALALWARALGRGGRSRGALALGALVAAGTLAGAAAWAARSGRAARAEAERLRERPREGRPGGYVTSDACLACHPAEHASWHRSYHRTMTQYASPETVRAPFEGVGPLRVKDGHLDLSRRGDELWVSFVPRAPGPGGAAAPRARAWRVGLVTGSHHMQMYWVGEGAGNRLEMFPYAYLLADRRWVPARDTFLADPRIEWRFDVWNTQCLQCHVTAGQPRPLADGRAMESRVGEMGIGCESCHGPGEEHVRLMQSPVARYAARAAAGRRRAEGRGPALAIVNPARLPAREASEVCGQCHGFFAITDHEAFLRDGFSYLPGEPLEPRKPMLRPDRPAAAPHLAAIEEREPDFVDTRFWPDGMVRVAGREWTALERSACHARGGLSCLTCHSMHRSEPDDQLAVGREGNGACLPCHGEYRERLEAHTRHAPGSAGSLCYNCHMPYTTYGLLKGIRSHEIDSPKVATTLATGRPNACNLCHLDRTLAWTAERLAAWYGQGQPPLGDEERTIAAAVLWAIKGDAAARALVAFAMGWDAARVASGAAWLAPYLVLALNDSYAAVRYIAARSLRKTPGLEAVSYDYAASPDEIERSVQAIIARWASLPRPPIDGARAARVLLRPDGVLETARVGALLAKRDERSLELRE